MFREEYLVLTFEAPNRPVPELMVNHVPKMDIVSMAAANVSQGMQGKHVTLKLTKAKNLTLTVRS